MTTTLIVAGGFLGAGKTTLLLRAARLLVARGLRVGLVTNDQGDDLVDTALARHSRVPVVEVVGGCFCCRFLDLERALVELRRVAQPDVILAEPVGSCTDLMATVIRPLAYLHGDVYRIAPLSVLLDPQRELDPYTGAVSYLYGKQLAEAELAVVTKLDLLEGARRRQIVDTLARRYATSRVLALSAHTGEGVAAWLDTVMAEDGAHTQVLEIDYGQYADGEAALGWLNARGTVSAGRPFSLRNWLAYLLRMLDAALCARQASIAHVKAQVTARTNGGDVTFKASLTQSGGSVTWDLQPEDVRTEHMQFLLNTRVQTLPAALEAAVREVFAELSPPPEFRYEFQQFACFRPVAPQPAHRLMPT